MPFIFSDRRKYRLTRHLAFWLIASFGLGLVGLGIRPLFKVEVSQGALKEHVLQPLLYLPGQIFFVYTLLYWVIPRYLLRSKYPQAAIWAVTLVILGGLIAAISYDLLHDSFYTWIIYRRSITFSGKEIALPLDSQVTVRQNLPYDFLFALQATLNVAGFAAALKLAKHWYEKEYRVSILQREKLDAELQSLKAQLHPHFLFNTLNNIYSIAENTSPAASDMLLKLSALLRYILYECNRPLVRLSQEFTLIRDYIDLEKVRYTSLDLTTRLPADTNGYHIAPLLLLPLVENCFKHGTSQMIDQPWISIEADLREDWLLVKLINGKRPTAEEDNFSEGIGLMNVRKRLDLLYPGRHELTIISEPGLFIVNVRLDLSHNTPEPSHITPEPSHNIPEPSPAKTAHG
jgi:sensor histidine kinase YesM